jgi:hypothetical protein
MNVGQRVRIVSNLDGASGVPGLIGAEDVILGSGDYWVGPDEMMRGYLVALTTPIVDDVICWPGELEPILGGDARQIVDWAACPWRPPEEVVA